MSVPLISIVLPTYNRAHWLGDAIQSAVDQTTAGKFTCEIVVVDNNSTDDTAEVVAHLAEHSATRIEYAVCRDQGDSFARNCGVTKCRGQYLAFMDDDEIAHPDWLLRLYELVENEGAHLVGGAVHLDLTDAEIASLPMDVRRSLRERSAATGLGEAPRSFRSREFPGTGNLLVDREVFAAVGDFSTTGWCSDHDFVMRTRAHGFQCWFTPLAIVRHRIALNRVTQEFIDWDALRSGVMLAHFDRLYEGRLTTWAWLGARCLHGGAIAAPGWLLARLTGNSAAASNYRIRLRRTEGYVRQFLCDTLGSKTARESLESRLDFLRSREIGTASASPAGSLPPTPPTTCSKKALQ